MSMEPRNVHIKTQGADTTSNAELVLDLVMSYLPTRDCVRTSILSSKWRNRWKTIPILLFDESCLNFDENSQTLASIIDHVLLLHSGLIQALKVMPIGYRPYMPQHYMQYDMLPSSVYSCGGLIHLELAHFILHPPSYFKGFKNLKCLCLDLVCLTDDVCENLISSCPMLEHLTLNYFEGLNSLKIDAQNLQSLNIIGDIKSISFGHTMIRLFVVSFLSSEFTKTSLTGFLTSLPSVQRLELGDGILTSLADGLNTESTPFKCKDLYHLSLEIHFGSLQESLAALFLFRSSPNLTELALEALTEEIYSNPGVWGENASKCYGEFERLQQLTMSNFQGSYAELELLKYVLENSPVLEKITINTQSVDFSWKNVKVICGFKRASFDVEIIIDKHCIQKR